MNSTYFHHDCFHLNCLTNKVRTLETYHIASTHRLNLSEVLFSTHRVEELLQLIIGWYINIMVVCCFFCLFVFFRVVALEDNQCCLEHAALFSFVFWSHGLWSKLQSVALISGVLEYFLFCFFFPSEMFKKVLEFTMTPAGVDTAKLYPILMSSGLPREALGQIWATANRTTPGMLTKEELYTVLALIGVAQVNTEV